MKKFKNKRTNRHHLKSRSRGGSNQSDNIRVVNERQHTAFHMLFPNTHPEEIVKILNDTWIDPDYHMFVVEKRVVNALRKLIKQLT